jgi:glycosyltransferase involved in cell wall biosynthesis
LKILVISAQPPSPYSGGEIRLLNLLKHLSSAHEFTVLAPVHSMDNPALDFADKYCRFIPVLLETPPSHSRLYWHLNAWRQAFIVPKPVQAISFYSPLVQQAIDNLLNQELFDVIQVQQLMMAQYLPEGIEVPSVLDVDNLWSKLFLRGSKSSNERRLTRRLQKCLDRKKISKYEIAQMRKFTACLAVSQEDEYIIQSQAPQAVTAVVPNGVDTEYFSPQPSSNEEASTLLFTGTMSWEPNVDAGKYFVGEILPLVQKENPGVTFQIVGRDPTPEVLELEKYPGVSVTGFVEDIRAYLAACNVYVVPIRYGAGTRLKILEALAMGKAVVSTTIGAEGLQVTQGENILISDEQYQFASQIFELIKNKSLKEKLSLNGRILVEKQYDWSIIAKNLNTLLHTISTPDYHY